MQFKTRRRKGGPAGEHIVGGAARPGLPQVLAYGLLPPDSKKQVLVYETEQFDIHDVPLGHPDSFLEFNGVVMLAGIFEKAGPQPPPPSGGRRRLRALDCINTEELGRRLRESHSLLGKGDYLVFLVPQLLNAKECETKIDHPDLFRRLMADLQIDIRPRSASIGNAPCLVPEFLRYLERHGAASVECIPLAGSELRLTEICRGSQGATGFVVNDGLYVLPCHVPQTHDSALDMVDLVASCVVEYRQRISVELPAWLTEFRFTREATLLEKAAALRRDLEDLESGLSVYERYKRVLAAKSTPLVDEVVAMLSNVFGLTVRRDEKFIEDACLIASDGSIEAVLEIKGDGGSFKRADVGQVDGHRERLGLPATGPGLLIMNTCMKAASLPEKDKGPHADIIKKAVGDNVLMIRTLDLLRYADLIEQGKRSVEDFRRDILAKAGWLKVENGTVEIMKE